jgi:hypothetical protein
MENVGYGNHEYQLNLNYESQTFFKIFWFFVF